MGGKKGFYAVATLAHVAVVQRMAPWPGSRIRGLLSNKYVVWTTYYVLATKLRTEWLEQATLPQMRALFRFSFAVVCCLGWYNSFGPRPLRSNQK
jgi:hypothetical protein